MKTYEIPIVVNAIFKKFQFDLTTREDLYSSFYMTALSVIEKNYLTDNLYNLVYTVLLRKAIDYKRTTKTKKFLIQNPPVFTEEQDIIFLEDFYSESIWKELLLKAEIESVFIQLETIPNKLKFNKKRTKKFVQKLALLKKYVRSYSFSEISNEIDKDESKTKVYIKRIQRNIKQRAIETCIIDKRCNIILK